MSQSRTQRVLYLARQKYQPGEWFRPRELDVERQDTRRVFSELFAAGQLDRRAVTADEANTGQPTGYWYALT